MSKTTLHQFLDTGKLNGNFITVAVVKKIANEQYIVGDQSSLGKQ